MDKQVIINFNDGTSSNILIDENIKIYNLLEKLNIKDSYLTYNGKILNKTKCLIDYNIQNNDIIFENKRLKGGVFVTIVRGLVKIVEFFIILLTYLDDFIMIFVKVMEMIPLIFNPKRFIDDVIFAVSFSIKKVAGGMLDSMDTGTKKNPKKEMNDMPKVCVPPDLFNLMILIICPPLALMINYGGSLQGIFLVVVCAILTVWCYYFPGLIFAALHILC